MKIPIINVEVSKKMTVAVATILFIAANKALKLNLTEDQMYAMAGAAGTYLLSQGYVDAKEKA